MAHLFFAGMMGCGKTTLGQATAKRLDIPFYDLDIEIEKRRKLSIQSMIEVEGWSTFRENEIIDLKHLIGKSPGFVALGGGTLESAEAVGIVKDNGKSIFIDVAVDQLAKRIGLDNSRPILKECKTVKDVSKTLESIWARRRDTYMGCDYRIEIEMDEPIEQSVERIIELISLMKLTEVIKSKILD